MSKLASATFLATALTILPVPDNSQISLAGTCASHCGQRPIQFTPGQYLRVQVINSTAKVVKLERLPEMQRFSLPSGQKFQLDIPGGAESNLSFLFWDETGKSLKAVVSKPNFGTLRVEIRPGGANSHRSLELLNDGRIRLF
jgi:NAD(P)H-flavin reductase